MSPEGRTWQITDDLDVRLWFAVIERGVPAPVGSHDELKWLGVESLESPTGWIPTGEPFHIY